MTETANKSLTSLDATFLYLEIPDMPMHVGSFNLCALPACFKGGLHKAVMAHIGKCMHLVSIRCAASSLSARRLRARIYLPTPGACTSWPVITKLRKNPKTMTCPPHRPCPPAAASGRSTAKLRLVGRQVAGNAVCYFFVSSVWPFPAADFDPLAFFQIFVMLKKVGDGF